MGDFDINLLNPSQHGFKDYEQYLLNSNFSPLISRTTHEIPGRKKSCIDNIHTNDHQNVIVSGTLSDKISHHLPIFHFSNIICKDDCKKVKSVQYYEFCKSNVDKFVEKLSNDTENLIPDESNFREFCTLFNNSVDETCKLIKPKTTRRNNVNNPWITIGLVQSIKTKHCLYKSWKRTVSHKNLEGDVDKLVKYRSYNKHLKKLIKHAKYSYCFKKFENCNGNMKKTWNLINEIRGKCKKEIKPLFKLDSNRKITNFKIIANKFNKYYASLAESMNNSVTDDVITNGLKPPSFLSYMGKSQESSMFLTDCTDGEILELIRELENGKASDVPIKLIKVSAPVITPILRKCYNIFMLNGEFPDILKVGKITPIFKKGDQEKFENYRPVSTLPIFAKLFEKIIYSRLYDYLEKKNILYYNQYGFRRSHSCSHALNYSVSEIQKYLENDNHAIGIYIDLSKPFDTIEHTKLLQKLNIYGIRGNVHALLKSYLSNRLQYTSVLGENSSKLPIKYGAPQGSVLGPLLFLIYINDIAQCSNLGIFVLFADDTNIFVIGENINDIHTKANSILNCVFDYMTANQLHINMSKSYYMHFKPKRQYELGLELLFCEEGLEIKGVPIKLINTTKFLGVVIDDELSWLPHIQKLRQKLNRQIK